MKKIKKTKKFLEWFPKEWITWALQSLAWMGGIAVAIKQLIPTASHTKGLFASYTVNPNIGLLIWTGACVLAITGALKYWRDK